MNKGTVYLVVVYDKYETEPGYCVCLTKEIAERVKVEEEQSWDCVDIKEVEFVEK